RGPLLLVGQTGGAHGCRSPQTFSPPEPAAPGAGPGHRAAGAPHAATPCLTQQGHAHWPRQAITAVYFPLDAVVAIVSTLADGSTLEVATIGNEGVVGLPCFLQGGSMPFTAFVQVPGAALKMEAEVFAQAVEEVRSDSTACWRATLRSGAGSSGSLALLIW